MAKATPKQIAYIWVLARDRDLDKEDVRALTPAGSISAMSTSEASILIGALVKGVRPDYSQRPRGYHKARPVKPRPPRLPRGIGRFPSIEALEVNRRLTEWLAGHYGMTVRQFEDEKLAKMHYVKTHDGPMHKIDSSSDCAYRIEVLKHWKKKAIAAEESRQRSAASETAA